MLARLRQKLLEPQPAEVGLPVFCWVRFEGDVGRIWYFLRRRLFSNLLKTVRAESQLDGLLRRRLPDVFAGERSLVDAWFGAQKQRRLRQRVCDLSDQRGLDRGLRQALVHLHGDNKQLAKDWLLGEELLAKDLEKLELSGELSDFARREEESEKLVRSLCKFVGRENPIVFCFDQLESVVSSKLDPQAVHRFASTLDTLHDDGGAAKLLMSFMLSSTATEFKKLIGHTPLWRRIAGDEIPLLNPTWTEARNLTVQRLNDEPGLAKTRAAHTNNPLWPFSESRLEQFYKDDVAACTPRRWLEFCRNEFERVRGGISPSPAPLLRDLVAGRWLATRAVAAPNAPDKVEAAIKVALAFLGNLVGCAPSKARIGQPAMSISFDRAGTPILVHWFGPKAPHFATYDAFDRRLQTSDKKVLVVLFGEPDARLTPGMQQRTRALESAGGKVVRVSSEQIRDLNALSQLVAQVRPSNGQGLVVEGQLVREADLEDWVRGEMNAGPGNLQALKEVCLEVFATVPGPMGVGPKPAGVAHA